MRRPGVGHAGAARPGGDHSAVGGDVDITRDIKVDQLRGHFPSTENPVQPGRLLLPLVMRREQRKPSLTMEPDIGINQVITGYTGGILFMKVEVTSHNKGGVIGSSGDPLDVGQIEHGDMGGVWSTIVRNDPDDLPGVPMRSVSH
eukprot:671651-Amphidinium_carterae.1